MNPIRAEVRLYQYDGKLPFVQMMLNMMVAMGILDRIPAGAVYGNGLYGNGLLGRSFSGNSWYTNPYMRALMLRGYNPGMSSGMLAPGMYGGLNPMFANSLFRNSYGNSLYGNSLYGNSPYGNSWYGNNPFLRSPWMGSPWTMGGWSGSDFFDGGLWPGYGSDYGLSPLTNVYGANPYSSPVWGTPTWGVLPTNDYSNGYASLGLPGDSPWNNDDIDHWSKESWADPDADNVSDEPWQSAARYDPSGQKQAPIVLNNYITTQPDQSTGQSTAQSTAQVPGQANASSPSAAPPPSPLARLVKPDHPAARKDVSHKQKASPLYKYSQRAGKYVPADPKENRKYTRSHRSESGFSSSSTKSGPLCVTPFCGLKKPDLNGLWVANDGEMLGVKNDRYLWTDGNERYLTGQLKIENEYLLAKVEGYDYILRYKYKLADNHLLTLQPDGSLVEFVRVPFNNYSSY